MLVVDCPTLGRGIIGYSNLLALINYEPGIIVIHWSCQCGENHLAATGSIASADPERAAAVVEAARRRLSA